MTTDIFKSASEKKFTQFSDAVKTELRQKLAGREEIQSYVSDFDKIQQMKSAFAQINKDFGTKGSEE